MESPNNSELRQLPAVDKVIAHHALADAISSFGLALVTHTVRTSIDNARDAIRSGKSAPSTEDIVASTLALAKHIAEPSLKRVVNATGIVLHTNLGRAPLGTALLEEMAPVLAGYSNLEFDLDKGDRGDRGSHCVALLKFLTGAEDALVVNNNAAAVMLVLGALAKKREVIVSRGELIEIGGAFRIPEIMAASGCKMVEVGTTNRTRPNDYEDAFTDKTAILFKAHKSNYAMTGFVEEASLEQLADLAKQKNLISVYDLGSGMLRRPAGLPLECEPDVASSLAAGIDLVCFSGDKLLGGPQAGIIVGCRDLIRRLAKAPLVRALRPGKLTIAALSAACRSFLTDASLTKTNPTFAMLSTPLQTVAQRALRLQARLAEKGVVCAVVDSSGQVGGGSLPDLKIPSKAVALTTPGAHAKNPGKFSQKLYHALLREAVPVVAVLREGQLVFDVLTIADSDIDVIATSVSLLIV